MMKAQKDRELIKEFLDLMGNEKYDVRKYTKPVLVYTVDNHDVKYSLWEQELLDRFGLDNVDGWDFKEDVIFAPDWVANSNDEEEDELPEIDDDDLDKYLSRKKK